LTAAESAGVLGKVRVLGEGERLLVGGEVRTAAASGGKALRPKLRGPEVYSVG
jgi:hypothetical protein